MFNWPGLYANELSSTWKSFSVPGSGRNASSKLSNVIVEALLSAVPGDNGMLRNEEPDTAVTADADRKCLVPPVVGDISSSS